jgi:site-specific DNA-methyltransferase (adenine-specific)
MRKVDNDIKEKSKVTKEEWKEYTKTVWSIANTTHAGHPAIFPDEIPMRLIKLFSFVDETVLDPFAGTGTTGAVAIQHNRNAICIEQSKDFASIAEEKVISEIDKRPTENTCQIVNGDSRDLSFISDDSVNLIITSPPYWDKADYGNGNGNIGKRENYDKFLNKSADVFRECYRVLEPGRKICIVTANVNQQTEHGLLTFPLSSDFTFLLRNLGFLMVNEIIWSKDKTGGRWGSANSQRPIFGSYPYPPNFLFKNVHEYILIFSKPGGTKRSGPKVRKYPELMGEMLPKETTK